MAKNDEVVDYRKHQLVLRALKNNGIFTGVIYSPDKEKLPNIHGPSYEEVLTTLKNTVDSKYIDEANSRTSSPGAAEYVRAFQHILQELPDSYLAMLKAHYRAQIRL